MAAIYPKCSQRKLEVSTHSHPKVAATAAIIVLVCNRFQHTATRRWLHLNRFYINFSLCVSTHSHPKVAATPKELADAVSDSFNTQPPEGGCVQIQTCLPHSEGFNTQPPEGGCFADIDDHSNFINVSTHSHPKVAAVGWKTWHAALILFQHTATRRWLLQYLRIRIKIDCFNTQPPEGGCNFVTADVNNMIQFQHTATRRWLRLMAERLLQWVKFQHTATRRWLPSVSNLLVNVARFQHTATRRWLLG